jgi:hypothetical protein
MITQMLKYKLSLQKAVHTMNESAEVADGLKMAVVKNSARWNAQRAMT